MSVSDLVFFFCQEGAQEPKSVPADLVPVTCDNKLPNQHVQPQSINTYVKVQPHLITFESRLAVLSWMDIFNTERLHNFTSM